MLKESGPLYISEINKELGFNENSPFYFDTPLNRKVIGKPTGPIYLSDFYGKGYQDIILNANTNIIITDHSPGIKLSLRILFPVTLPTINVDNYVINGNTAIYQFFSNVNSGINIPTIQYKSGSSIPKTQTTTLYAWYKVSKITIKLNSNWTDLANLGHIWLGDDSLGMSVKDSDITVSFTDLWANNDLEVSKTITHIPERRGFKFLGWATSPAGDVIYQSNTPITGILSKFNNNTVLYAKWQKL